MSELGDSLREALSGFGNARVIHCFDDWADIRLGLPLPNDDHLEFVIEECEAGLYEVSDGGDAWESLMLAGLDGEGWFGAEEERAR